MRGRLRQRVYVFGGVALVIAACTYDFDDYVEDGAGSGGVASTTGGAGGSIGGAGDAGASVTPGGGTTGGTSARGGAAGATNPGGEGGGSASGAGGDDGEDAGAAGTGKGGSASGGSASGGTANGGSTAGATANGGTATAGAGGSNGLDCDALNGTVFDGHCYFYVNSLLDFASARSECAGASATLVAINSQEEQRFLESTFFAPANDAWIGLSLADLANPNSNSCKATPSSCPFRWATDEPVSFTKWGNHGANDPEPNYTGACVRIQAETLDWADQGCTERVRAICEAE